MLKREIKGMLTWQCKLYSKDYESLGSTIGPGFDYPWERNFLWFNDVVLLVVGDVYVNSEARVVTSSISRMCRFSLRRCS